MQQRRRSNRRQEKRKRRATGTAWGRRSLTVAYRGRLDTGQRGGARRRRVGERRARTCAASLLLGCAVLSGGIGPVLKRALPHSALGEPHLGDTRVVGHGIPYEAHPRCCRRRRAFVVRISPPWVPKTSEAGRGALPNSVLPNEEPMKPHEAFEALLPGTPPTQVVVGTGAANLIRRRAGHRLCSDCLGWGA